MTTPDLEPTPKPKRKRRSKAEIEAARQAEAAAEAAKPIDPMIWIILGGLLLVVAAWIWLDPVSFANAGQPADQGFLQIIPSFMVRIFGKTPTVLILAIPGTLSLIWGVIGWLRKRFDNAEA
ncbi:MAG: hypothetical protein GC204_10005 [Chloroflexi bacterium]|nr:hypothetical protein [Chloroflexota bacterium]